MCGFSQYLCISFGTKHLLNLILEFRYSYTGHSEKIQCPSFSFYVVLFVFFSSLFYLMGKRSDTAHPPTSSSNSPWLAKLGSSSQVNFRSSGINRRSSGINSDAPLTYHSISQKNSFILIVKLPVLSKVQNESPCSLMHFCILLLKQK